MEEYIRKVLFEVTGKKYKQSISYSTNANQTKIIQFPQKAMLNN